MLEFHATLLVCKHGYRWEQSEGPIPILDPLRRTYLAPGRKPDKLLGALSLIDAHYREYDPFRQHPTMFLEFAALGDDADSILGFAEKYGELLVDNKSFVLTNRVGLTNRESDKISPQDYAYFNSLDEWIGSIRGVANAVELWKQVEAGEVVSSELDETIEARLAGGPFIRANRIAGQLVLQVEVNTLIHAIWAQFASAVAGKKQYRECDTCRKPFELTPEITRSDRLFCSDACRSKSYRRRKSAAAKMHSEGRKLREIARELGTDLETLKRWLGE